MKTKEMTLRGRALSAVLACALIVGLMPSNAFAENSYASNGEDAVETTAPEITSQDVPLGVSSSEASVAESAENFNQASEASTDSSANSSEGNNADSVQATASASVEEQVANPSVDPDDILNVQVNLSGAADATDTAIAYGGLTYAVNPEQPETVALTGWTGNAPKDALVVPARVKVGQTDYTVTAIAAQNGTSNADNASIAANAAGNANPYATEHYAEADKATGVTSISIPATVEEIDPTFFQMFPNATSIAVANDNPNYKSHNGMLFDKQLANLLLVPEGMEGAAVLPDSMASVPACAFTRCTKLSAIEIPTGSTVSARFAAENGVLYSADKTVLLAAPAGLGTSVTIAPECVQIAEGAFLGNALQTIVVNSNVDAIDVAANHLFGSDEDALLRHFEYGESAQSCNSFNAETVQRASIALTGDYSKTAWEAAGFTDFTEPAQPGEQIQPVQGSGFAFTLLDDYTLAVRWQGEEAAPAALDIPEYGMLNGVQYAVSAIADEAFAGQTGIVTVDMPAAITAVGSSAFDGCANLKTVHLANSVRTIGKRAFAETALLNLVLPVDVAAVADEAFAGLSDTTIVAMSDVPQVSDTVFSGATGVNVYAPYNKNDDYEWVLGAIAQGNHLYPYGVQIANKEIELSQGEEANLYEDGTLATPGDVKAKYAYKAAPINIDTNDGTIKAVQAGNSKVNVTLELQLQEAIVYTQNNKDAVLEKASYSDYANKAFDAGDQQVITKSYTLASDSASVISYAANLAATSQLPTIPPSSMNGRTHGVYSGTGIIYRATSTDNINYTYHADAMSATASSPYMGGLTVKKIAFKDNALLMVGPVASGVTTYYKVYINESSHAGVNNIWYRTDNSPLLPLNSGVEVNVDGKSGLQIFLNWTEGYVGSNVSFATPSGTVYRDTSVNCINWDGHKGALTATEEAPYKGGITAWSLQFSGGSVFMNGVVLNTGSNYFGSYKIGLNETYTGVTSVWYRAGTGPLMPLASGSSLDTSAFENVTVYLNWNTGYSGMSTSISSSTGKIYRCTSQDYISWANHGDNPHDALETPGYRAGNTVWTIQFRDGSIFMSGATSGSYLGVYKIGINDQFAGVTEVWYRIGAGPLLSMSSGSVLDVKGQNNVHLYLNWNESYSVSNVEVYAGEGGIYRGISGNAQSWSIYEDLCLATIGEPYVPGLDTWGIQFIDESLQLTGISGNTNKPLCYKVGVNKTCTGVASIKYQLGNGPLQALSNGNAIDIKGQSNVKIYINWEDGFGENSNIKIYAVDGSIYKFGSFDGSNWTAYGSQSVSENNPYAPTVNSETLQFTNGSLIVSGKAANNQTSIIYKLGTNVNGVGISNAWYRVGSGPLLPIAAEDTVSVAGQKDVKVYINWNTGYSGGNVSYVSSNGLIYRHTSSDNKSWYDPFNNPLTATEDSCYTGDITAWTLQFRDGSIFMSGVMNAGGGGRLATYKLGIDETVAGINQVWYRIGAGPLLTLNSGSTIDVKEQNNVRLYLNMPKEAQPRNTFVCAGEGEIYRATSLDAQSWQIYNEMLVASATSPYVAGLNAWSLQFKDGSLILSGVNVAGDVISYKVGVNASCNGVNSVKYRLGTGAIQELTDENPIDIKGQTDVGIYINWKEEFSLVGNAKIYSGSGSVNELISPDGENWIGCGTFAASESNPCVPNISVKTFKFDEGSLILNAVAPNGSTALKYKLGLSSDGTGVSNVWYRAGSGPLLPVGAGSTANVDGETDIQIYLNWTEEYEGANVNFYQNGGKIMRAVMVDGTNWANYTDEFTQQPYQGGIRAWTLQFIGGSVFMNGAMISNEKVLLASYKVGLNETYNGINTVWYKLSDGILRPLASGATLDVKGQDNVDVYLNWSEDIQPCNTYVISGEGKIFRATSNNGVNWVNHSDECLATEEINYHPSINVSSFEFRDNSLFLTGMFNQEDSSTLAIYKVGINSEYKGVDTVWYKLGDGVLKPLQAGMTINTQGESDVRVYINWNGEREPANTKVYSSNGTIMRAISSDGNSWTNLEEELPATLDSYYQAAMNVKSLEFKDGSLYLSGVQYVGEGTRPQIYKVGVEKTYKGVNNVWYMKDDGILMPLAAGASVDIAGENNVQIYLNWKEDAAKWNVKVFSGTGVIKRATSSDGVNWLNEPNDMVATQESPYTPALDVWTLQFRDGSLYMNGIMGGYDQMYSYKVGIDNTYANVKTVWYRISDGTLMPMAAGELLDVKDNIDIQIYLNWTQQPEPMNSRVYAKGGVIKRATSSDGNSWNNHTDELSATVERPYSPALEVQSLEFRSGSLYMNGVSHDLNQPLSYKVGLDDEYKGVTGVWYVTDNSALRVLPENETVNVSGCSDIQVYLNWEEYSTTRNSRVYSSTNTIMRATTTNGTWVNHAGEQSATEERPYQPDLNVRSIEFKDGSLFMSGIGFGFNTFCTYKVGVNANYNGVDNVWYKVNGGKYQSLAAGTFAVIAETDTIQVYLNLAEPPEDAEVYNVEFYKLVSASTPCDVVADGLSYENLDASTKIRLPQQGVSADDLGAPYITDTLTGHMLSGWTSSQATGKLADSDVHLVGTYIEVGDIVKSAPAGSISGTGTAKDPYILKLYAAWNVQIDVTFPTNKVDLTMKVAESKSTSEDELAIESRTVRELNAGAASLLNTSEDSKVLSVFQRADGSAISNKDDIDDTIAFEFGEKSFAINGGTIGNAWAIDRYNGESSEDSTISSKLTLLIGSGYRLNPAIDSNAEISNDGVFQPWGEIANISWNVSYVNPDIEGSSYLYASESEALSANPLT